MGPAGDDIAARLARLVSTDAEFAEVDREIRRHTLERFGPVRSVRPTLVFELGFEGIHASPRHKSGIALRFPRMLRIRHDKPLHDWTSHASDAFRYLAMQLPGDARDDDWSKPLRYSSKGIV